MSNLKRALDRTQPAGVYRFETDASPAFLKREAKKANWRLFTLNGSRLKDKGSFLQASARAMDFPSYVGKNWDAFEEAINDLSWAPASGYVLLIQNPEKMSQSSPQDWETALEIFETASKNWTKQGVPFYLLIQGDVPETLPNL